MTIDDLMFLVEEMVCDDLLVELSMTEELTATEKALRDKCNAIYRYVHSFAPVLGDARSCHLVHDDWREEARKAAAELRESR